MEEGTKTQSLPSEALGAPPSPVLGQPMLTQSLRWSARCLALDRAPQW